MQYFNISYSQIRTEILSGLTISIALVPEAISFALLVGVAPAAGLWAAFFMALSTSLFGGRPGMISGATGATAVVLSSLVIAHGDSHLYLAVILAGLIQILIWLTRSWKAFQFIPRIVVSGFLTSLAILIFMSQLKYFNIGNLENSQKIIMFSISIISAVLMYFSNKWFKFPAAIIAIFVGSILSSFFILPSIGDLSQIRNELPSFTCPEISVNSILLVLPYSFGMAISGLTESLIMVDSVCDKLGSPLGKNPKSKETFAQAVGNIISGFFTSIGGCVLVGQTNLNVLSGAKHRISSLIASLGLLLIILVLGKYIQLIPLPGLIGVMFFIVYDTGEWSTVKKINPINILVLSLTIFSSLFTHNLAIGVMIGSLIYYIIKYKL